MQHSNIYVWRTAKIIAFIAIFTLINGLFYFLYKPALHKSDSLWQRYSYASDIDTVFIGTSIAEGINCSLSDEITGYHSFNMATPSQYFATSDKAIRLISKQQPVKRVVILLGFDSLENDVALISDMAYDRTLYASSSLFTRIGHTLLYDLKYSLDDENSTKAQSVNIYTSWVNDAVGSYKSMKDGILYRLGKLMTGKIIPDYHIDPDKVVYDRCEAIDSAERSALLQESIVLASSLNDMNISSRALTYLDDICAYCYANDIELLVALSPHTSEYREIYSGRYESIDDFIRSFVVSRHASYYNLDNDPQIQSVITDDCFYDTEHISDEYSDLATEVISDIVMKVYETN